MKYSHNYAKLDVFNYTTIRRYPKGKVGDIVKETYPKGSHYSEIVGIERRALNEVYLTDLLFDTDCDTREEAYRLFQSFYKKIIDFDKDRFYVYFMEKVEGMKCANKKCGKEGVMLALFEGKWYCSYCHNQLIKARDMKYYRELLKNEVKES